MYDYWITLPLTPAFLENIQAMTDLIAEDGESPTILYKETGSSQSAAIGTKAANGKTLLHFRLLTKHTSTSLINYLESVMTNPIPPLSVEIARSAYKIIEVPNVDPEVPSTFVYEEIVIPNKATFLPFMNDIADGVDNNGETITRPPNITDDLYLSGYLGSEPIKL